MHKINFSKHRKTIYSIIIAITIIISFALGFFLRGVSLNNDVNVMREVIDLIYNNGMVYDPNTLEISTIRSKDMANTILNTYMDDYAVYYDDAEYNEIIKRGRGEYSGIGVSFIDTTVYKVILNSPAEIIGILSGDKVIKITYNANEYSVADKQDLDNALTSIPLNQEFTLRVLRGTNELDFNLKKQDYIANYVEYQDSEGTYRYRVIDGKKTLVKTGIGIEGVDNTTAYVRFTHFEGDAFYELKTALEFMQSKNRTKLIFDLRDNGGGYVSILQDVASLFIKGAKPVMYCVYANNRKVPQLTTKNCYMEFIEKMVILANEKTASASECLINALLSYNSFGIDRNTLIIENSDMQPDTENHTFGKGIMQETFLLNSGGALKMTTALIYAPDDKTTAQAINKNGDRGIYTYVKNSTQNSEQTILRAKSIIA